MGCDYIACALLCLAVFSQGDVCELHRAASSFVPLLYSVLVHEYITMYLPVLLWKDVGLFPVWGFYK